MTGADPTATVVAGVRAIPGVVAVTLGGSRATGTARADSDWDFGLYVRGELDVRAIEALGWPGRVFRPGEWGRIVNGGAWLVVDGVDVDLVYRDLDAVEHAMAEAEAGRFTIEREVGYVAGIASYVPVGELALGRVLSGVLPNPDFPAPLRSSAPPVWSNLALGALRAATGAAARDDAVGCLANLSQAVLAAAQGRLAAAGEWAINEKRIVERSGLGAAQAAFADRTATLPDMVERVAAVLDLHDPGSAWA